MEEIVNKNINFVSGSIRSPLGVVGHFQSPNDIYQEADLGLESEHGKFLATRPWENDLIPLTFSFHICKMGKIIFTS